MLVTADGSSQLYPWQARSWEQLLHQYRDGRLPHALMLNGPPGCGKQHLASQLVNYLLCSSQDGNKACGQCKGCQLLRAGSHPDALMIEPDEPGKAIKVDQIRSAAEFVAQTAQMGGYKGIIISPAESLNINAANALLKILEEPGAKTVFVLVSSQFGRVTATVRSRCNKISLAMPAREDAKRWLAQSAAPDAPLDTLLDLAGNSPLLAMQAHEEGLVQRREQMLATMLTVSEQRTSGIEVAKQLESIDAPLLLNWLQSLMSDLVKIKMLGEEAPITLENERHLLLKIAQHISLHALYFYIDGLIQARQTLLSGHNPNKLLLLEDLLISWSNACRTGAAQRENQRKR